MDNITHEVNYTKENRRRVAEVLYRDLRRHTIPMIKFINTVLIGFRGCFSREATFKWFVTVVIGMMTRNDNLGVTSVIRALSLKHIYEPLIRFFKSDAWNIRDASIKWASIVGDNTVGLVRIGDSVVLIGDSLMKSKEGRRMPAVKRLHQASENSSKEEYIYGQLFGCVGMLAEQGKKTFCIPLACELQDGVRGIMSWEGWARLSSQTVEMIKLAHRFTQTFPKAILLLDRYYLTKPAIEWLDILNIRGGGLRAIIMAKFNVNAYEKAEDRKPGERGAPRKKRATIKLADLFITEADKFKQANVTLYGKDTYIKYLAKDLLWGKGLYRMMRFVIVQYGDKRAIIASTDTSISPINIVVLYAKRFSIECTFKSMKYDVAAFSNRFWSKSMPKLKRYEKFGMPDRTEKIKDKHARKSIRKSLDAPEGYVFCGVVAVGLLQMLSLRNVHLNEIKNTRYLRTPSRTSESEATIADYLEKYVYWHIAEESDLPVSAIILEKMGRDIHCYEGCRAC